MEQNMIKFGKINFDQRADPLLLGLASGEQPLFLEPIIEMGDELAVTVPF
jgi:hypothetical protein